MSSGYDNYEDMLDMPHHVSKNHPPLSMDKRAAQFSPFAALTGYDESIEAMKHARCNRIILSEEENMRINNTLLSLHKKDRITITYFIDDPGSDGAGGFAEGEYVEFACEILQIEPLFRFLRVTDKTPAGYTDIPFDDILSILQDQSDC